MLSINTNLSSIIAQNSLKTSTNKLNEAVERMSTGCKINHAKDNAANYSISTDMTTKMGAYMVAEDNVAMGLDLVTTASDIISQMESKASRLRALSTQASNGTYGNQSMSAIQSEACAIMQEITRLYLSSEYNGISLFDRKPYIIPDSLPQAGESGFIDETAVDIKPEYDGFIANPYTYSEADIQAMASINTFTSGASGEFKITSADELAKLAKFVNDDGYNTSNATFVLANDIDLEQWCADNGNWVPIGKDSSYTFKGTFDGNGNVIKNLKIENATAGYQGLFGFIDSNAVIKNVGLEESTIVAKESVGGILGYASSSGGYINNCYSEANVSGTDQVGGLAGSSSSITNSYATGNVSGTGERVGGLAGRSSSITNSYVTGNVSGNIYVGGLAGSSSSSITNSYATGNVSGNNYVGGLTGYSSTSITTSYATGDVYGTDFVGGLIGQLYSTSGTKTISSSYSLGNVTGTSKTGSLIGGVINTDNGTSFGTINISDCYTLDKGMKLIGGCYSYQTGNPENTNGYDAMVAGISIIPKIDVSTNLQVGIHSDEYSQISFNTNFKFDLSSLETDISSKTSLKTIDDFIQLLSNKQTELGAVQNRLESALDEISIQYDNLVSSRSTLRDADMAEFSSTYIQQQILQEASATLMATANQMPAIALQLL